MQLIKCDNCGANIPVQPEVDAFARARADLYALRTQRDALLDALERILDAGEYVWSEADDAMVYSIYLPESSVEEFQATIAAVYGTDDAA